MPKTASPTAKPLAPSATASTTPDRSVPRMRGKGKALVSWLRDFVVGAHKYRGAAASMMTAIEDPKSALYASCVTMKAAGARLLARAQAEGMARSDLNGADLFALAAALAWLGDQPSHARRADHLFDVIASAILMKQTSSDVSRKRRRPARR